MSEDEALSATCGNAESRTSGTALPSNVAGAPVTSGTRPVRMTMTQHHGVDSVAALKRENARLRAAIQQVLDGPDVTLVVVLRNALEGKD